jgi:hypothetical protein
MRDQSVASRMAWKGFEHLGAKAATLVSTGLWTGFVWLTARASGASWSRDVSWVWVLFGARLALAFAATRARSSGLLVAVDAARLQQANQRADGSARAIMWGACGVYAGFLAANAISQLLLGHDGIVWIGALPGLLVISLAPVAQRLSALRGLVRAPPSHRVLATLVEAHPDALVARLDDGDLRSLGRTAQHDGVLAELDPPFRARLVGGAPPAIGSPYRDERAHWTGVHLEPKGIRVRRAIQGFVTVLELSILWMPAFGWIAWAAHELGAGGSLR